MRDHVADAAALQSLNNTLNLLRFSVSFESARRLRRDQRRAALEVMRHPYPTRKDPASISCPVTPLQGSRSERSRPVAT